jgi:hypothetical protein
MMSFKDDPLQEHHSPGGRTLWLNRENNTEAREAYWRAYHRMYPTGVGNLDDKHTWDVSWAAAIAAFTYMMEGRTEPK